MSWQSTHATLTRNMQKSPTCTAVGQAFLFPTRTSLMLLCSSSKDASRRPSFFLATRKCWAAESFNPGGRAGLQMWPSTHDGTTWEVQQLNNACGAALKCMHKPYDIIYKPHAQRETGVLPSPTQAGTPDTSVSGVESHAGCRRSRQHVP